MTDCEVITARDPETGDTVEAVVVPDGYVLCLVSDELAATHADWKACVAVRITSSDDGSVGLLEVTDDEDWVTGPDAT